MGLLDSYLRHISRGGPSPWWLLSPLHLVSKWWVLGRNFMYDHGLLCATEGPLPVVSVGNLTLGGTNKTPMVEALCRLVFSLGLRPGVVSRGYSGAGGCEPLVVPPDGERRIYGDEPLMLARKLRGTPVVVSRDRVAGVRLLRSLGVQVAVADDCFQHRQLARDADLVLVDATCPFGNGLMFPAGMLREPVKSLRRADLVIITKADQVGAQELEGLEAGIRRHVRPDRIFRSSLLVDGWSGGDPRGPVLAFCAIGNPMSFLGLLEGRGVQVASFRPFRDHHRFGPGDLMALEDEAERLGARWLVCTEKDLMNLPGGYHFRLPLSVLRVRVGIEDEPRFLRELAEVLAPRFVVASNGHGEDAIGAVLCGRLKARFPAARVEAFPLVGEGVEYREGGFPVSSPVLSMPSGGLVKYGWRYLLEDLRSGLAAQLIRQLAAWRGAPRRTPLCVGDVYLFLHALWGRGMRPLLLATAKTVYLSGHWRIEGFLLRHRALAVWTRDRETREELASRGVDARFDGNPIMDLAELEGPDVWEGSRGYRVLVLPGSRSGYLEDLPVIARACLELGGRLGCSFLWVPALSLDVSGPLGELGLPVGDGWSPLVGDSLTRVCRCGVGVAALGAQVVLGLGGTANQICAGLGVPVVSLDSLGKRVQKRLLGDSEELCPRDPVALADCLERILSDPDLRHRMGQEGSRRMGPRGALDRVVDFAARELGWDLLCLLWERLDMVSRGFWDPGEVRGGVFDGRSFGGDTRQVWQHQASGQGADEDRGQDAG